MSCQAQSVCIAHLAFAVARAAARAVELALRAAGDRADPEVLAEAAIAAAGAFLGPDALRFKNADELRVEARIHGFSGKTLGQRLDARAAAERTDRVVVAHALRKHVDERVFALALDGAFVQP